VEVAALVTVKLAAEKLGAGLCIEFWLNGLLDAKSAHAIRV